MIATISPQNIHLFPISPLSSISVAITNYVNSLASSFKHFYDAVSFKQHYAYSSFGELQKVTDIGGNDVIINPVLEHHFTYTGREYDQESGLYHYRARAYDASIGRFLQVDPEKGNVLAPMTFINSYAYVLNDSVNRVDPSGRFSIKGAFHVIGGAVLGGVMLGGAGSYLGSFVSLNLSKEFTAKEKIRANKIGVVVVLGALVVATGGTAGFVAEQGVVAGLTSVKTSLLIAGAFSLAQESNFVDNFLDNSISGLGAVLFMNVLYGGAGTSNSGGHAGPLVDINFFHANDISATIGILSGINTVDKSPNTVDTLKRRLKRVEDFL